MAEDEHSNWIGRLPEDFKDLIDGTPEDLRDIPLILYLRCKYDLRDKLKKIFSPADRTRIDLELERVDKLRSTFARPVENNILVQSMTISRRVWRDHAKNLCRGNSEKEKVEKALLKENLTEEQIQRYRTYTGPDGLLERVRNWTTTADPVRPSTSPKEDKGYGFVVQRITLKRNDGISSFGEYVLKTYPVHDVLYDKDNNPLTEKCEADTIRYFHFPANCMLWVEVCNSSGD